MIKAFGHNLALRVPAVLAVAALSLVALAGAVPLISADFAYTEAATRLSFWHRDNYSPEPEEVRAVNSAIDSQLIHRPRDPDLLSLAARARVWLAAGEADLGPATAQLREATALSLRSLELRPALRSELESLERMAVMAGRESLAMETNRRLARLHRGRN